MRVTLGCPQESELSRLLLGRSDDGELLDHVAGCDRCAERASAMAAEDDLVLAMRSGSPISGDDADTIVERARRGVFSKLADVPAEVGPYAVERLLGAGGMGVVYLARDARLGRRVALKLVAASGSRERFLREAESAARVRHPNVVTLYEAGEWRGSPYLVMEYVEGGTLAERLREGPLPPRVAAAWLEGLARGVAAAHAVGVVHRDLKPANVLLSDTSYRSNEEATPKIADFGLAKRADDPGHTSPGEILGTPSYMAPEQADHADAGPPADIYALGAILYECLAGRPPFQAATALATLELVRAGDPVPPARLQPGTPRDLQVIALKCLEQAPARRYASAAALADDLRRWLNGQPILGRPAGVGERVWKWARRRPAAASLMAVCALGVAALAVGLAVHDARMRRALAEAQLERERAAEQSREARDAVRRMLYRIREGGDAPGLQQMRRALLAEALAFYEQTARQTGDDRHARHDIAWACLEAGKVQSQLGRKAESLASCERALLLAAELIREVPDDARAVLLHADALAWLGASHDLGTRSIELQRQATDELEDLLKAQPGAAGVREQLAGTLGTLGSELILRGKPADALPPLQRSLAINSALAVDHPNDANRRQQVARTRLNLARALYGVTRKAEGDEQQELASADFERLHADDPSDLTVVEAFAALRVNRSYSIAGNGQLAEAVKYVSLNLPMLERAHKLEPDEKWLRQRLFETYGVRAMHLQEMKRLAEAAASWEKAIPFGPEANRTNNLLDLSSMWLNAGDQAKAVAVADALRADPAAARRLAELYGRAAEMAGSDPTIPLARRDKLREHYLTESRSAAARVEAGPKQ